MAEKNMNAKISVEFEETANRQQLSSGDNLPTLFGKIKKFFTDLKAVAFSGSYNDLSDKPTIPSAVTESTVSGWGFTKNTGTYSKPSTGIPASDLASGVIPTALPASNVTDTYSATGTDPVSGKAVASAISNKVDKISGKGLSTNDLTATLKSNYDDAYTHSQSAHAPSSAQANVIETIKVNNTALTPTNKTVNITIPSNTDRYVNSANFADDSTATAASPVKMTLTRAGSDTNTITANIPKVSSSSAGVVPKGSAVSSQSTTTKFLREDGTWATPSYTTNTDTKVTAVGNHYTPAKSTTKSASGGTLTDITNSASGTQVITGVEMDAKGHVTGVTSVALKSTDTKVTVDSALSGTSTNPVQNKVVSSGLASKADASHTHTEYALKSKYGDTTINVGRKADTTVGGYSTSEGDNTTAIGYGSHAEGKLTTASGHTAHAEGSGTTANGSYSHAEGVSVYTVTNAIPDFSNTTSDEDIINVWNKKSFNLANGLASHSEGRNNLALGIASHAEGYKTIASGENSHTGGHGTKALHLNEVAYGIFNESNDDTLFSIGDGTADGARHNAFEITTTGGKLHDKDIATIDDISTHYALKSLYGDTTINVGRMAGTDVGRYSTAEGFYTTASGLASHAEGVSTVASGGYSHAEGLKTTASGDYSHAGGYNTIASHDYEVAYGIFNVSNENTLFSIGNGTEDARHNAFEITATGGKLHDKDIATLDNIPTSLPANGGNADTLDGHHADYFAKYDNPSIEGAISLVRAGNATTAGSIFAWEDTLRLRNQDPNAENTTYTDLLLTPSGIFTEGVSNGNYIARKEISTTPIKKISFPSVATNAGGGGVLFSADFGTPITIACTSRGDTQCTPFYYGDGNQWLLLAKDCTTLAPIPAGSYSFDVWYI